MAVFKKGTYVQVGSDYCVLLKEDYDTKIGGPFEYVNYFSIWDSGHGKILIEKNHSDNYGGKFSPILCEKVVRTPSKQFIEVCEHLLNNNNLKWGKIRKKKITYYSTHG